MNKYHFINDLREAILVSRTNGGWKAHSLSKWLVIIMINNQIEFGTANYTCDNLV